LPPISDFERHPRQYEAEEIEVKFFCIVETTSIKARMCHGEKNVVILAQHSNKQRLGAEVKFGWIFLSLDRIFQRLFA
jgi:hypothetical protein